MLTEMRARTLNPAGPPGRVDDTTLNREKIERNKRSQAWMRRHLVQNIGSAHPGKVAVRSSWIESPEDCIKTRDLDELHVLALFHSMLQNGMIKENITLIMWKPKDKDEAAKYNTVRCVFNLESDRPPHRLFAIIGDHTSTAVKKLNRKFPRNADFDILNTPLLIVERSNENIAEILYIGTLDNTIASLHKSMTQWDCVKQMRTIYVHLQRVHAGDESSFKEQWRKYKQDCEGSMPYKGGTFSTFSSMAILSEDIFSRIKQIFTGQYVTNPAIKQGIPKAMTCFQNMGNIDSADLCKWLDRVLSGQYNCATFSQRCAAYKLEMHVKTLIVEYVNTMDDCEHKSWEDVVSQYPRMGLQSFIEEQIGLAPKKRKDNLQSHAKTRIDQIMELCRRDADVQRQVEVQI
jgi:hypothetical protein